MKAKRISFFFMILCLSFSIALLSVAAVGGNRSSLVGPITPSGVTGPKIGNLAFIGPHPLPFIAAEEEPATKTYSGFLFEKRNAMCSKSEGPDYYLQLEGEGKKEIRVFKHGTNALFAHDLTLDRYLLTKVTITGTEFPEGLVYKYIETYPCLKPTDNGGTAEFKGYLFCKLDAIGTRSEGPSYYLQDWDYQEFHIVKETRPREEDPKLHPLLNTKVTITGALENGELVYREIKPLAEK